MIATVETEYGKVKGVYKKSALGTSYISFQGIPYMKAPLGKLRFRDAEEPDKWTNVFDATKEAPSYCTNQNITFAVGGQEDAAIINIFTKNIFFTKNINPKKLYPVMVWVHGGGYRVGSSKTDMYGPDYILEKDVILVSFNYRLGVIGFLSLENESLNIPGNAGLKDQIFALKWIQRNIRNFGGDPGNVTLFGESAGAAGVHILSLSELAKGLFHRAIIMSGTAFCQRWALIPREYSKKYTKIFAQKLGWDGNLNEDFVNFLENVPAFDLMAAINDVVSDEDQLVNGRWNAFGPVIEPYISKNCLIPKDPMEMARDAWSNNIDIIFTVNSMEGMLFANIKEETAYHFLQNPASFAPLYPLNLKDTDSAAKVYGERIKKLYYKEDQKPSKEHQYEYIQYLSDSNFNHDIYRTVLSRLAFSPRNTYFLRFHVNGTQNFFKKSIRCDHYKEACHIDDLFYIFKCIFLDVPARDSKEFIAIERMVGMLTGFAIKGSPSCKEIEPVEFIPLKSDEEIQCLQIAENDVAQILLPELNNLKVWNSVYEDHKVKLF